MYSVDNNTAMEAARFFEEKEGCDLHPAAAVALAGLHQAVLTNRIDRNETVLLNITGGGIKKVQDEGKKISLEPDIVFGKDDLYSTKIMDKLDDLLKVRSS